MAGVGADGLAIRGGGIGPVRPPSVPGAVRAVEAVGMTAPAFGVTGPQEELEALQERARLPVRFVDVCHRGAIGSGGVRM